MVGSMSAGGKKSCTCVEVAGGWDCQTGSSGTGMIVNQIIWLIYITHNMHPMQGSSSGSSSGSSGSPMNNGGSSGMYADCGLSESEFSINGKIATCRNGGAITAKGGFSANTSELRFFKKWYVLRELNINLVILNKCKKGKLSKISPSPAGKLKKVKLSCSSRSVSETPVMQDSGKQALR